jgi:hypothetical protein
MLDICVVIFYHVVHLDNYVFIGNKWTKNLESSTT